MKLILSHIKALWNILDKKGFSLSIHKPLKASIIWGLRRRNLKLFHVQQQAVYMVQNIWVYNGKHCHVINTSDVRHGHFKKYIDISPQRLYPTMMFLVRVYRGAVGRLQQNTYF